MIFMILKYFSHRALQHFQIFRGEIEEKFWSFPSSLPISFFFFFFLSFPISK